MLEGSVARTLGVYAFVTCVGVSAAMATAGGSLLLSWARQTSARAQEETLLALAAGDLSDSTLAARGIAMAGRQIALQRKAAGDVVVRVPGSQPPTYLCAPLRPPQGLEAASAQITKLLLLSVLVALAGTGLLTFLGSRLILQPMTTLRAFAALPEESGLIPSRAPNEVADVAYAFRRTVRKLENERALAEAQHAELQRMHHSLVRTSKLASVGRLAAGIAHEIGNPLAAVSGYLTLLRQGLPEAERDSVLERSSRELNRIHETIKKLLAFARPNTADEPVKKVNVARIVEDAVSLVRGHAALRSARIEVYGGDVAEGETAYGRPQGLSQVIVNLIINAGQACREIPEPIVVVEVTDDSSTVDISVSDNGPGIAPEMLESIFDPFFTTKATGEGTGLGLAISRSLTEAMDGELLVQNLDPGARFTIRLRSAAVSAPPEQETDSMKPWTSPGS